MRDNLLAVLVASIVISSAAIARTEQRVVNSSSVAANLTDDCFVVDEESRSPEGSAHVTSEIFERKGDEYKSTRKSIPVSLIEQIRNCALKSESFQKPNIKDFGVTEDAVRAKVELVLKSDGLPSIDSIKYQHPTFEQLDPKVKEMYEYGTIAKAALEALSNPWNSGYMVVRVRVPGDPPIILHSRSQQNGMVPWSVKIGNRSWHTFSSELPKLLAQFGHNGYLANDESCLKSRLTIKGGTEWFDEFFYNYHYDHKDQVKSIRDIQTAQRIKGWDSASESVNIEDANVYNDGSVWIQVRMKDPGCAVDRIRWTAQMKNDSSGRDTFHDWNDFLQSRAQLERAAGTVGWLKDWREKSPGRSLVGTLTAHDYILTNDETTKLWNKVGLSNRPEFHCQLYRGKTHTGELFVGAPYKLSLVTDLGFSMQGNDPQLESEPTLRANGTEGPLLDKRIWCLVDQTGARVAMSTKPQNYALTSGVPYPSPEERAYDHGWPVDFGKGEDVEYLDTQLDEKPIERMWSPFEKTLNGEVDKTGNIVLKPEFDWLGAFSNGLASYRLPGGKFGYVNEAGAIAIDAQFEMADTFHEGLAAVKKNDRCGFIDSSGNLKVPLIFDSVRRFSEGLAPARQGSKFGYIDKTGEFVIQPQFGRARHFVNGLAYVQLDEKRAYIDHSGKPIGGQWHDSLNRFSDDRAVFERDGKFGYIDHTGHEVIPAKFTKADDFRDGIAPVYCGKTLYAIDTSGRFITKPPSHSDFWDGPITENLIRTRADSHEPGCGYKFGFKNQADRFVIKPVYHDVGVFDNGLCPAQMDSKWGVIDKSGKFVIKPEFDQTEHRFSEHRLAVKLGDKWGVIDASGAVIVQPKYDCICPFSNGMAVVQSGLKFGYINAQGAEVIAPQFDAAHSFGPTGRARIGTRAQPEHAFDLP